MKLENNRKRLIVAGGFVLVAVIVIVVYLILIHRYDQRSYTAQALGIKEIQSDIDADCDTIDDYTDVLNGAKKYIAKKPIYKSKYYAGGYPDDGYGVCTDVIWNALMASGYDLKAMMDLDIANDIDAYQIEKADPNIDFRRVRNIKVYLERHAESLTVSKSNAEEWQAGDIVVFPKHIAICSDKRNKKGIPFIIHHDSRGAREANDMNRYKIEGHYRWKINYTKKVEK